MFIVNGSIEFFAASGAKCCLGESSLTTFRLWSSCLSVKLRIYKHSAPPELRLLVAARLRCGSLVLVHDFARVVEHML